MKLKFIEPKQTNDYFKYKITRRKLYKVNAAIWYNKECRQRKLTPAYVNIKIKGNNRQCRRTKEAATLYRLNQEIKFLHYKKQRINQKMHLECANKWKNLWTTLDQNTEEGLSQEMETHYTHLNQKLDNLQIQQQKKERRKPPKAQNSNSTIEPLTSPKYNSTRKKWSYSTQGCNIASRSRWNNTGTT